MNNQISISNNNPKKPGFQKSLLLIRDWKQYSGFKLFIWIFSIFLTGYIATGGNINFKEIAAVVKKEQSKKSNDRKEKEREEKDEKEKEDREEFKHQELVNYIGFLPELTKGLKQNCNYANPVIEPYHPDIPTPPPEV